MARGDSADILLKIKKDLIPKSWFSWVAPYRDAVIGGLADSAAWCYGLIGYARNQSRLFTASGVFLDIIARDFLGTFLPRKGLQDTAYRALIRATILQERVTRAGMIAAITKLTGLVPSVFEPWNTFDTGAYSGVGGTYGSMGYGVGQGGYGNMNLPAQVLMQIHRSAPSGIPSVDGYGNNIAGWGTGSTEYAGPGVELVGITNDVILDVVNKARPTGCLCWVAFN